MSSNRTDNTIIRLSIPTALLIIIAGCIGLFTPGFYSQETLNWQAQSVGQDMADVFIVSPMLIITAVLAWRKNKAATLIRGGVLLYLIYTFVIYCFAVHFNNLFIVYCTILGLCFYLFIYFLFEQIKEPSFIFTNPLPVKVIAIYFFIISILFYCLWLSEIIPAVARNTIPKSVVDAGLFTNPVHAIDLSVILPGIFITGILMLRKKRLGYILAPVMLTFFILMNITIGLLIVVMKEQGLEGDLSITVIMAVLTLLSIVLLTWYLKNSKPAV